MNLSSPTEHENVTLKKVCSSRRSVSFSKVSIREHEIVLGDHPDCSDGAPVGLGWTYKENDATCIELYEKNRGTCRTKFELKLSKKERRKKLKYIGMSSQEIAAAEKQAAEVRHQRVKEMTKQMNAQKSEKMLKETCSSGERSPTFLGTMGDTKKAPKQNFGQHCPLEGPKRSKNTLMQHPHKQRPGEAEDQGRNSLKQHLSQHCPEEAMVSGKLRQKLGQLRVGKARIQTSTKLNSQSSPIF